MNSSQDQSQAALHERDEYIDLFKTLCDALDVQGLVVDYAANTKCACGVVTMRGERITEVAGCSDFCRLIRKSTLGDSRCMYADLLYARQAFDSRSGVMQYRCHLGLVDFLAPIVLGGRHVANIYGGQVRPDELSEEDIPAIHKNLDLQQRGVAVEDLAAAFKRLPFERAVDIEASKRLLSRIAALISERADWALVMDTMVKVSDRIGPGLDRTEGLTEYLHQAKRAIRFDSGSIVLWDEAVQRLRFAAMDWGPEASSLFLNLEFKKGEGLAGTIFQRNQAILCIDRRSIDETPAKNDASRDMRQLQSFIGVPITVGNKPIGVLEIGSRFSHCFDWPQVDLLKAVASHISVFLQVNEARSRLVQLVSEEDLCSIVRETAKLVKGRGCSLFLRGADENALLAATLGLDESEIGKACYAPGEGLTGWVFKTGRRLRLPAGNRNDLTYIAPDVNWKSKYREFPQDERKMENRPFLAVPVLRSNHIIGVLRVSDRIDNRDFSEEDERLLAAVASHIASVLDAIRLGTVAPFLDPRILRTIVQQPSLTAVKQDCTIWFTDIRRFSALAEALADHTAWVGSLLSFTSDFYALVTDCVSRHNGVVTDLRGDGAMALFGISSGAAQTDMGSLDALDAAFEVRDSFGMLLERYRTQFSSLTTRSTEVGVAFGLMTGEAVVGPIETPGRKHFTALGPNVNLAQRICAAAPPGAIWVGAPTYTRISTYRKKEPDLHFCQVPDLPEFKNIPGDFKIFELEEPLKS